MAKVKSVKAKKTTKGMEIDKGLAEAMSAITKEFGANAIMSLDPDNIVKTPSISTGSLLLDNKTGGFPIGRIIEIYGPEASGKTTLTLHAAAECQKTGGKVAFIDAEHALDVSYAKDIGVQLEQTLLAQPGCGEEALEIVDKLVGHVDLIIVDSVAALTPRAELEGDMGQSHMALQARLMSQALRKLTGKINQTKTTIIFLNQLRVNIGGFSPMGTPKTTTGGESLKYYASLRLQIGGGKILKKDAQGNQLEKEMKVYIKKNKLRPLASEASLVIGYGKGIVLEPEILRIAYQKKLIVSGSGHHYYYGEDFDLESENPCAPEGTDAKRLKSVFTTKDKKMSKFATNGAQAVDFLIANPKFTAYLMAKLKELEKSGEIIDIEITEEDAPATPKEEV